MPDPSKKFYVTTPIYYVNARPHIGHAYTTVVADVVARRHRLLGDKTWFLTGTDEHGQKIERSAAAAGIPPQQFADEVSASFKALWARMGITNDDYIRTTDARHKLGAQKLFAELYQRGEIYLSSYTGQYSVGEEMFVEGPPGTLGPDGRRTETVTEENFFFRLSNYQLRLLELIESGTLKIQPDSRRNEVHAFLTGNVRDVVKAYPDAQFREENDGSGVLFHIPERVFGEGRLKRTSFGFPYVPGALKDLSVSRSSFTWGIPVPEPAASAAKEPHVIYVWLDALANYMTALGYGSDDTADQARFAELWPADLHLVGKEIIRFHCVYWPAFLLAAGLPLPRSVVAHGWLLFEDSKMSKSRGNIVRTETILAGFGDHYRRELVRLGQPEPSQAEADLFASDVLRYFLLREIPFGQDGSFSFDAMITRYNADLANGYGNLVSRTLAMIERNLGNVIGIPFPASEPSIAALSARALAVSAEIAQDLVETRFTRAALSVATLITEADGYFSGMTPWKLAKSTSPQDRQKLEGVLYTAAESIRILTALLYPILPYATAKVWAQLGLGSIEEAAARGELKDLQWGGLRPGTALGPLAPIFPRAPKELAQIMSDSETRPSLTAVTDGNDAATSEATEFPTASFSSVATGTTNQAAALEAATFESTAPSGRETGANTPGAPSMAQPLRDMGGNADSSSAPLSGSTEPAGAPSMAQPFRDMGGNVRPPADTVAGATEPTSPAAPPRTSTLPHTNPGAQVGASSSPAAVLPSTPSHVDAEPSGVFSGSVAASPMTTTPTTSAPQITIDDFAKVELRVAKILVAERIPKADKLLRLEVDLGPELGNRQILSGIAEWYHPESLVGRTIVVITNLAPRKMRGLESHGMLLAGSAGDGGKPVLTTMSEDIPPGTRLK